MVSTDINHKQRLGGNMAWEDFSRYQGEFVALASVHFLAVVAPGADFAITVQQSVRHGRMAGTITACGIGCGISVHVIYTLLGVSAILHGTPWMMNMAQILGALYLLYLGLGLLSSKPRGRTNVVTEKVSRVLQTPWQAFRMGFLTNATNPKATLFFLAVFTTVVSNTTPLTVQAGYGVWMCLVNATWFVFVSRVFSEPKIQQAFLSVGHRFEQIMGLLIVLLALRLALNL
jgi:RhtB (resistance to homoserine/threonine) family protein